MGRVIDFARYRCARPPHSASDPQPDRIEIALLPDGTYKVTYRGQYARSTLLAVEHLSDCAMHLAHEFRRT